jgi:hypothetical protein
MSDELARREYTEVSPEIIPDDEPEFIMVGVRRPGGIILFVSRDVTETKFARRNAGYDAVEVMKGMRPAMVPRTEIIVGAKMTSFEQILGDNYLDALKSLARYWEERKDPRALPPA